MAINGTKGRTRWALRLRRKLEAEARAAGVNPADRRALAAWNREREAAFWGGLQAKLDAQRAAAAGG